MPTNPFTISEAETKELVKALLGTADVTSAKYSVHLVESLDPAALLATSITSTVFQQSFGNSPEFLMGEYAEFLPSMLHIVACDFQRKIPIGSIGIIRTPAEQLKTVVDLAKNPWNQPSDVTLSYLGIEGSSRKC